MKIILFRGRPGVGKTTISDAFTRDLNYFLLRKDDLYDISSQLLSDHNDRNKIAYKSLYKLL
jgi:broad-specificity NMP kinase